MNSTIQIGPTTLALDDYAIGASAILGIRDSGKTVTAKMIAEQLLDNNIPIVVFDAVGKWKWLRVKSKASNGKAFKVVVVGGTDGLPLDPHTIEDVVRAAVKERVPIVLDLFSKDLSKADWRRIVQKSIRVCHYENQGGPLHVFLEEAAEYCPQRNEDPLVYSEIEKLVRMGGNAQVGITIINQRSQEVAKAVLDQCTTLILGCQVGNKAIESVDRWIERLDPQSRNEVAQSLPKLKAGQAWVWTRRNPEKPVLAQLPMCRSMHPDRREVLNVKAYKSASVDADDFTRRMQEAIPQILAEKKANDPSELRKEIGKLKTELEAARRPNASMTNALKSLQSAAEEVCKATPAVELLLAALNKLRAACYAAGNVTKPFVGAVSSTPKEAMELSPEVTKKFTQRVVAAADSGSLKQGPMKVLQVIVQFAGASTNKIAVMTGYKQTSRYEYLRSLKSQGLVTEDSGGMWHPTQRAIELLPPSDPLPIGRDLTEWWKSQLSGGERVVFETIVNNGHPITKEEIGQISGYKSTSVYEYARCLVSRDIVVKETDGTYRLSGELSY